MLILYLAHTRFKKLAKNISFISQRNAISFTNCVFTMTDYEWMRWHFYKVRYFRLKINASNLLIISFE